MKIEKLTDIMSDYEVPYFFKRATGRKYNEHESCINDIRRMLFLFCKERNLTRHSSGRADLGTCCGEVIKSHFEYCPVCGVSIPSAA